jgi:hypothetical protein
VQWLVALSLAIGIGGGIGLVASEIARRRADTRAATWIVSGQRAVPSGRVAAPVDTSAIIVPPDPVGTHEARRPRRIVTELDLLQPARAAVARQDFADALRLIAEHDRRFADGHLLEEGEALRIEALVGLDRIEEARDAALGFARRFPRSVLLPTITRIVADRS